MCIALIGGMDKLKKHYIAEASKFGVELEVFSQHKRKSNRASKIGRMDEIVIFTNKISHRAKDEVMNIARKEEIPVSLYHSCGISTLRSHLCNIP